MLNLTGVVKFLYEAVKYMMLLRLFTTQKVAELSASRSFCYVSMQLQNHLQSGSYVRACVRQ